MKKYTKQQIIDNYGIYKASQCTDMNDVKNSIRALNEVIYIHGDCPLFLRRLFSLRKKEMDLKNETIF